MSVAISDSVRRSAVPHHAQPTLGRGTSVVLYTSSDCWRGAGNSYVGIARGLEAHGFRPHAVSLSEEVTEEFRHAGVPVTQLPARGRGESWRLRRYLGERGAHVLIVDRAHDLRVGTLAVLGTGCTLVHRYSHFGASPPTDALTRVAYARALRGLVFLSWSERTRVLRDMPFMRRVRPTTIYEGSDASFFRPSFRASIEFRRAHGLGAEPFLLAVGALSAEKRYELLFDALRLLQDAAPPLVVCGEGPDELKLRSRADELGLRVRFLGRVPQSELIGAYNASTLMVHAGGVETFGLAVLEAMSCARPVVVSAGGALPEVVGTDGDCGRLFAPNSAWDMSNAIRRLLYDPDERARLGNRARERARTKFSLEAMEANYARFVARLTPRLSE
ncbi:MAG TPA: glycosyltransferase family 4 protein [Gemmatimonadaceae bacterium]